MFAFIEQMCYIESKNKTNVRQEGMDMKKHGERMELIGALALLLLAMASDGGNIGLPLLFMLGGLSVGMILLGDMFTRPRRKHRNARHSPAAPSPAAPQTALRPAA